MKWKRFFREGVTRCVAASWAAALWLFTVPASVYAVSMQTYCNEPPFASAGIKPNLLLMLDNSASMYDAAYLDSASYCVDNTYRDTNSYVGYFDRSSVYRYDPAQGKEYFVAGATLPSGYCSGDCAALTPYLYVEMTGNYPFRTVKSFIATGNFLNWLSASKMDVQKQVLTGGKWDPATKVSEGESRGCDGKHVIKMLPEAARITFATRGPNHNESDYSSHSSLGGTTRIEIYDKGYNRDACLKAVKAWLDHDRDELIAQSNACLDAKLEPATGRTGTMPTASAVYNQVMVDCFDMVPPAKVPVDRVLRDLCNDRCSGLFGECLGDGVYNKLITLDGICAAGAKHGTGLLEGFGYLGTCLGTSSISDGCVQNQTTEYCLALRSPLITDPSSLPNLSGDNAPMPYYILDAGVANLGNVSGTFKARVLVDSPPRGLIQEFSSSVNFGLMVFNPNGASPAESGKAQFTGYCKENANRECTSSGDCTMQCILNSDGGKILSYINDSPSVGDHGSGLIAQIDGLLPRTWTPYAEAFYNAIGYFANRSDLQLNTTDFLINKPPSKFGCQKNHVLIFSDGMSTMDTNTNMETLASVYAEFSKTPTGNDGSCPVRLGSRSLDDLAWIASHRNIRTLTTSKASTDPPVMPSQSITTHVIFTGASNGAAGQCDPAVLMRDTAASGGGVYAAVSDPGSLGDRFRDVLRKVAEGSNAGTDSSIISTGEGNGAVFLQEQFYPQKSFDGGVTSASWIGEMSSLWYYIDPFLGARPGAASTVRADSDQDRKLTLKGDEVVSFRYDPASSRTWAYLSTDSDGDGTAEGAERGAMEIEQVPALWRAGYQLWSRDIIGSPRVIYTPAFSGSGLIKFSTDASTLAAFKSVLQAGSSDAAGKVGLDPATALIQYVQGKDFPGKPVRSRRLNIPPAPAASDTDVGSGKGVWKLGDIIASNPKLVSGTPLASYHLPPPKGYNDASYAKFIGTAEYQKRGMVYVGANDGMLHAFNFGSLVSPGSGDYQAELNRPVDVQLGSEQWAFIPKNALPYLKYLMEPNYRHLYYVDGSITVADVNIGSPTDLWHTVLIGGMGLGGASGCVQGNACVQAPGANGYSSYFALDVTDPAKPVLLWEFSNPDLGYATSGVAVVRSGDRWFAVFGSGPTGPIDEFLCQFKGYSDRKLKIFIVDLKAKGPWILGTNYWVIDTNISYAFAGSMSGGGIDVNPKVEATAAGQDPVTGKDDAVYLGYVRNTATDGTWTSGGGVLRLLTKESPLPYGNPDPVNDWSVSKLIDGVGPVTAGVAKLVDRKNHRLWIYFGSGSYFNTADDPDGQRYLVGVQDRCFAKGSSGDFLDKNCDLVSKPPANPEATGKGGTLGLADLREIGKKGDGTEKGWYITLDGSGANAGAERLITDPVALTSGAVLFTSFQPNKVPCQLDTSYLWRVKYDSGDAFSGPVQGKALVPLSTGSTEGIDLSGSFGDRGGRRGPGMLGRPGGLKVVTNSGLKPLRKIIHIQER